MSRRETMKVFGYARVSTADQNLDMQLDALNKAGCERIFSDKVSGKLNSRPELDLMLDQLRPGDKVVVYKLDRLGRNLKHLIEQVEDFKTKGIEFESLQEKISTDSAIGKLTFHVFGAMAEFERSMIRERIIAGQEAGRARGRNGGRPHYLSEKEVKTLKAIHAAADTPIKDICKMFNISKATLYRYLDQ
jgi:DNA invertase Pin-like site-specific DNA recombinase